MAKSKKVQMPAGIRNKLMAAIAMLLVSSIMMVSSTYAWFTLSTAPEVTGITTSVGANGNLEIALLTTDSFESLSIDSLVGSSSAVQDVTKANITWGNLVDLSATSYGLQNINLQPSRLGFSEKSEGGYDEAVLTSVIGPLLIPQYGKDGRVSELSDDTYSTTYTNSSWAYDANNQQYGVRAIGANDNLSPQEAGLIAAKAAYSRNLKNAQSAVQSALSTYGNELAGALTSLAMGGTGVSDENAKAIKELIAASEKALNYIDAAYKQVLLGYAANLLDNETAYNKVVETINEADDYAEALTALMALTDLTKADGTVVSFTEPPVLADTTDSDGNVTAKGPVSELKGQKDIVAQADSLANPADGTNPDYAAALKLLVDSDKVTINGYDAADIMVTEEGSTEKTVSSEFTSAVIKAGGVVVAMPDGSGVFAYVGSVAGNYSADCLVDIEVGGQNLKDFPAKMETVATEDATVSTALGGMTAVSGNSTSTVLSDTYGYALDFAVRTNAADSNLLLQTKGVQRVYGDSSSAATQGAGSTMTFKATTTDAGVSALTSEQIVNLMKAIRVAFVTPAATDSDTSATVHAIAALENIVSGTDGYTGDLVLQSYSVSDKGALVLDRDVVEGSLTDAEGKVVTVCKENTKDESIMALTQNQATRLTAIVYLDGDLVDNGDVANAAQSLVGTMNLQFASSATLIPMQNTALQNMSVTYTELTDSDYAAGLYTYEGTEYVLNTGYKLYQGSDNEMYFSNNQTDYTKLTNLTYSTAMSPLTVAVTGNAAVVKGGTTTLTVTTSVGEITAVTWSTSSNNTITSTTAVTDSATNVTVVDKINVNGLTSGSDKITAAVVVKITGPDGTTTTTVNKSVEFTVVVGAYTVSFNANNGTGTMSDVTAYGEYTLPECAFTAPTGKQFVGWAYSDGTAVSGTINVTEDITLYAIWEDATYSVTFNANDGDSSHVTTKSISTVGEITTTSVERVGYQFLGWSTNSGASVADSTFELKDGLVLYAVWQSTTTDPA